jgi:hypothetical protein
VRAFTDELLRRREAMPLVPPVAMPIFPSSFRDCRYE